MVPGNGAERKAHAARRSHCLCGWRLCRVPVKVSTVTTDVAVGASYRRPPPEFFSAHFSLWLQPGCDCCHTTSAAPSDSPTLIFTFTGVGITCSVRIQSCNHCCINGPQSRLREHPAISKYPQPVTYDYPPLRSQHMVPRRLLSWKAGLLL